MFIFYSVISGNSREGERENEMSEKEKKKNSLFFFLPLPTSQQTNETHPVKEAGPFKTVLILRLGPVPYSLLSYCLALSPEISYWKYIVASVIGHMPDNAMHVFLGASFEGIGSIVKGEKPTPQRIASVAVPLAAAIAVCIGGTIYGKRAYAKVRAARAGHAAEEAAAEALGGTGAAAGASSIATVAPAALASSSSLQDVDLEMAIKK